MTTKFNRELSVPFPNTRFDVVGMAASAGGLSAIQKVLSALPHEFPCAIVIVQHVDPKRRSLMAEILSRTTPLSVKQAEEGDKVHPGNVYIAPPNQHLLINPDGSIVLSKTELVHYVRPSADQLFESLASGFKERCLVVVLTGTGEDGNHGVEAVKKMGGVVVVQDEGTSEYFGMPAAAIQTGCVDRILPIQDIASFLIESTQGGVGINE